MVQGSTGDRPRRLSSASVQEQLGQWSDQVEGTWLINCSKVGLPTVADPALQPSSSVSAAQDGSQVVPHGPQSVQQVPFDAPAVTSVPSGLTAIQPAHNAPCAAQNQHSMPTNRYVC